ncbi:Uncharacterised protein [Bordetella ansorpii]|uniref:Uncharacterized protein n=1 Tax=Bordetella ansorpii TaxID=288768 RepID=A0A146AW33_9BORD|nr:hypothetical protein [Bordetella ansorpii]CZZ93892.1 Uncharacterised protein [Bordetella ansorpii]
MMDRRRFFSSMAGYGAASAGIAGMPALAGAPDAAGAATLAQRAQAALSRKSLSLAGVRLRYGARTLRLAPGVYHYDQTLELDGDLCLAADGPPGSVILNYTGSDVAIVVNSRAEALRDAPHNTRSFSMENITLVAERASRGMQFGAATQPGVTLRGVGLLGVPGCPLYCGDAVYFLALRHCTIRGCGAPVHVGAYCDLFTVDDRCLFTGNPEGALLLQCPTFLVANSDFESNGGLADIVVRNAPGMAMNRNGLLLKNRHGPETAPAAQAVRHDIALVEAPGLPDGTAITDLRIWANDHFSGGRFARKRSPVLVDARIRRLDIRSGRHTGYAQSDYVTTSDAALVHGTGTVWDSQIDNLPVQDAIRGLFQRNDPLVRRAWAAEPLGAGVLVRATGFRRAGAGSGMAVSVLRANADGVGYDARVGWLSYATPAGRPIELHASGAVIHSTLDGSGAVPMSPVYLQADGSLGLAPPRDARPLRAGILLEARCNADILLD